MADSCQSWMLLVAAAVLAIFIIGDFDAKLFLFSFSFFRCDAVPVCCSFFGLFQLFILSRSTSIFLVHPSLCWLL